MEVSKTTVMGITAILRKDEWTNLARLEMLFPHARQVIDVLHYAGVIRSRNTADGSDLQYQWIR